MLGWLSGETLLNQLKEFPINTSQWLILQEIAANFKLKLNRFVAAYEK